MKAKTNTGKVVQAGTRFILVRASTQAVLEYLTEHGDSCYSDISEQCGLAKSQLYVLCQRLEKLKLIKRVRKTSSSKATQPTIQLVGPLLIHDLETIASNH